MVRNRVARLYRHPLIQRITWHLKRIGKNLDPHFFVALLSGLIVIVAIAALAVMLIEKERTFSGFGETFYWAITTVMGQGDASHVTTWGGWVVSWLLVLFGVGIVATITGALLGFVIDFLLKEGQGMGASGYTDHIVICGWNATARSLVEELRSDDYNHKVVVLHDVDRNPADGDIYFVRGDATKVADLERAGIEHAAAAIICPADSSDEADMRSILVVLAIESVAPHVRTVAEVNNPNHAEHFRRADVDELLITAKLTAHLLARTSLYPGLTDLVTDLVSGGDGSELYRIALPDPYIGLTIDDLSARMRSEHSATLLAVSRNGTTHLNPPTGFVLQPGDNAVVVAESLGTLAPLVHLPAFETRS
ncbi:MAG: NAD-binding protein [Acidimicrobiia bacterium]|nr:NAD-binding protein [Acidimicrobiia bacterium]